MPKNPVPDIVIGRLPIYLRSLQRMANQGRLVTSSQELAERLGISAAQIRKDLSQFGEFGKQGTGYNIAFLSDQIQKILHIENEWKVVVVGAGDIGTAVARYKGFNNRGFQVDQIFDSDPMKIGLKIESYSIQDVKDLKESIQGTGVKIAMITVPAEAAQIVADQLVDAGIKALLNYAPIQLNVPADVHVQYIDPAIHLQRMTYYLA